MLGTEAELLFRKGLMLGIVRINAILFYSVSSETNKAELQRHAPKPCHPRCHILSKLHLNHPSRPQSKSQLLTQTSIEHIPFLLFL
jgi:hypothetical protein